MASNVHYLAEAIVKEQAEKLDDKSYCHCCGVTHDQRAQHFHEFIDRWLREHHLVITDKDWKEDL